MEPGPDPDAVTIDTESGAYITPDPDVPSAGDSAISSTTAGFALCSAVPASVAETEASSATVDMPAAGEALTGIQNGT